MSLWTLLQTSKRERGGRGGEKECVCVCVCLVSCIGSAEEKEI